MLQSQLGDLLAKSQWLWARHKSKLKVKDRRSEPVFIIVKKAMYSIISSLKKSKLTIKRKGIFLNLKLSFKPCNLPKTLLFRFWKPSKASREIVSKVIILGTTRNLT